MSNGAWMTDPSGRHQLRWWDGQTWSSQVHDHGVTSEDPMVDPSAPACGVCGTVSVAGDAFCGSCGTALPADRPTPSPDVPVAGTRPPRPPLVAILGGLGVAVALIAVVAVLMLRGDGDSDSTPVTTVPGEAQPPVTEPVVTQPAITQPVVTEPPGTEPPATQPPPTEPPGTEPPATGPGSTEHFQEVSGRIDETTGSFLALDVRLEVGDALRYRVEPGAGVDASLLVLVDSAIARANTEEWIAAFSSESPPDLEDTLAGQRQMTAERLNPGAARTTFEGLHYLVPLGSGLTDRIRARFIVALQPGEYIVLAQASEGSGEARLMVEVSPGRLTTEADLRTYRFDGWSLLDTDPWFDDRAFFYGTDPYTPGMIGTTGGRQQSSLAAVLLEDAAKDGIELDRSCALWWTAQLSDEDATAAFWGREEDLSPEGSETLVGLRGCYEF